MKIPIWLDNLLTGFVLASALMGFGYLFIWMCYTVWVAITQSTLPISANLTLGG